MKESKPLQFIYLYRHNWVHCWLETNIALFSTWLLAYLPARIKTSNWLGRMRYQLTLKICVACAPTFHLRRYYRIYILYGVRPRAIRADKGLMKLHEVLCQVYWITSLSLMLLLYVCIKGPHNMADWTNGGDFKTLPDKRKNSSNHWGQEKIPIGSMPHQISLLLNLT